jgi:hypothetical protein
VELLGNNDLLVRMNHWTSRIGTNSFETLAGSLTNRLKSQWKNHLTHLFKDRNRCTTHLFGTPGIVYPIVSWSPVSLLIAAIKRTPL